MIPAMAAAGPVRAINVGLDGGSGCTSLSEVCGDSDVWGDLCSALPVISM